MDEIDPRNERWMRGRHARPNPLIVFVTTSVLLGITTGLAAILAYVVI